MDLLVGPDGAQEVDLLIARPFVECKHSDKMIFDCNSRYSFKNVDEDVFDNKFYTVISERVVEETKLEFIRPMNFVIGLLRNTIC